MKALYYHGLGGEAPLDLIGKFESMGIELITKTHIFEDEYENDLGKSMMAEESEHEGIDFVIGNSYGGYVAYHIGKILDVPTLLFNPAIDRSVTKTGIGDLDFDVSSNSPYLHLVLGKYDSLVNPNLTLNYLHSNKVDYTVNLVNIEHQFTTSVLFREVEYFINILKNERVTR